MTAMILIAVGIMAIALVLIPLGLPGTWIMIAVLAAATYVGEIGLGVLVVLTVIAVAAELVEYLLVRSLSARYGGTRLAFWGALIGGLVGVLLGAPVPVLGSVVAGVLGSFLGAAAATLWETRRIAHATRVGWAVVLARILAVAAKMAAGIVILVSGATALLVR